jgi:hypothetical protein
VYDISERSLRDYVTSQLQARALAEGGLVLEEMQVGGGRIDVALLTPRRLKGFELKSDSDSLARLHVQIETYSYYFDHITIVTGPKWAGAVVTATPPFWGVLAIGDVAGSRRAAHYRWPSPNPKFSTGSLLDLLWRYELNALAKPLLARSVRGMRRKELVHQLTNEVHDTLVRPAAYAMLLARYQARRIASEERTARAKDEHAYSAPLG